MGFLSGFFGGGKSESTPTRLDLWTPQQQALFSQLIGGAQRGMGTAAPSYAGKMYTPTTPQEQAYFDFMGGRGGAGAGYKEAMGNILAGRPAYDINPAATEKYYQESIRNPALKEFRETTAPLLAESFSGPGYWSSGRADATQKAISDLTSRLMEQHGQLVYGDEQARRIALENAIGRVPGAGQTYTGELGSAGQLARQIGNEEIASNLQRYLMGESVGGTYNPAYNPQVQIAMNLLGMSPYAYGTKTTQTGPGLGYSLLSGFASGLGKSI